MRRVDVASSMRGRARVGFRAVMYGWFLRVLGRVGLGLVAHGGQLMVVRWTGCFWTEMALLGSGGTGQTAVCLMASAAKL